VSRALKHDIPGTDWRISVEDVRAKGFEAIFGGLAAGRRMVVEIGFGRGEFLRELARRDPGTAHLGIEYSMKRVLKMARRLARDELGNIRLLEAPAELVVRELLPAESVTAFWVNFPDPWPKKRHHRRRLLGPPFVHELALRLAPGGRLEVATDHAEYAEAIEAALQGEPLLENLLPAPHLPEIEGRLPTAYELEWRKEGRALYFWRYGRSG
jgi:tRNA (guanine-N7-)-methyltransferase